MNHRMGAGNRHQVCKSSQCSETLRCEFIQSTSPATEEPEKVELHPGLGTCHHPVMVCHHGALGRPLLVQVLCNHQESARGQAACVGSLGGTSGKHMAPFLLSFP